MQVALALPLPPAPRAPGGKNPSVHRGHEFQPTRNSSPTLKGGKFEMDRSKCPVAKILVYIEVHGFLPIRPHLSPPSRPVLKAGNFELIEMGLRAAEILVYIEVHEFQPTRKDRSKSQNFPL